MLLSEKGITMNYEILKCFTDEYLNKYRDYKNYWNYEDGCVLTGALRLYCACRDGKADDFAADGRADRLKAFVLDYLKRVIDTEGNITTFDESHYNIDNINSGKVLFFAYDETGDERYKKAAEYLMKRLDNHPRTDCGSFWHKEIYPYQIWLDGLYMAQPFYMEYETRFNKNNRYSDIVGQFKTVRERLFNDEKKLYYHGYDEKGVQPWCNPENNCSRNFWLRSMGWYLMALIDSIEAMDITLFDFYRELQAIFHEAVDGILRYIDTGKYMFYQVIDRADAEGNYFETSGSSMVGCAILKACRLGVLPAEKYRHIGKRIFEGIVENKLVKTEEGCLLTDICLVAGLGPGEKRDGSVEYYLSEKVGSNDAKGVGPFMMLMAEYIASDN